MNKNERNDKWQLLLSMWMKIASFALATDTTKVMFRNYCSYFLFGNITLAPERNLLLLRMLFGFFKALKRPRDERRWFEWKDIQFLFGEILKKILLYFTKVNGQGSTWDFTRKCRTFFCKTDMNAAQKPVISFSTSIHIGATSNHIETHRIFTPHKGDLLQQKSTRKIGLNP